MKKHTNAELVQWYNNDIFPENNIKSTGATIEAIVRVDIIFIL